MAGYRALSAGASESGCGGMVDAGDLKSPDPIDRVGSSPTTRTIIPVLTPSRVSRLPNFSEIHAVAKPFGKTGGN